MRHPAPARTAFSSWIPRGPLTPRLGVLVAVVTLAMGQLAWGRAAAQAGGAESTIREADLRSHVEFLASDDLAGRAVGEPGNAAASRYVASALERAGVLPGVDGRFLQPFALVSTGLVASTRLAVRGSAPDARGFELTADDDFYPWPLSASGDVSGPLVVAGFGIMAPDRRYDDYAGIEVANRIVMVLEHAPGEGRASGRFDGETPGVHGTLERKIDVARALDASGLLVVSDGLHPERRDRLPDIQRVWPRQDSPRTRRFRVAPPYEDAELPVALISIPLAERLLARGAPESMRTIDGIRRAVDTAIERAGDPTATGAPASFAVPDTRVDLEVAIDRRRAEPGNVVGIVPGADARLRRELVVVGAHLDHDGTDAEGRVYNGADDNASGTAALLEVAEAVAAASGRGDSPRRTVVFAAWNAEEKGSLGSRHFVHDASTSRRAIVAMLNLDMIGRSEVVPDPNQPRFRGLRRSPPGRNRDVLHLVGHTFSPELARLVDEANDGLGLELRADYDDHAQDLVRRSDHWPFLEQGIPALFFTTGLHPDYHTPDDDADRLDYRKLTRVTRLIYRVTIQLARQDATPAFVDRRADFSP